MNTKIFKFLFDEILQEKYSNTKLSIEKNIGRVLATFFGNKLTQSLC